MGRKGVHSGWTYTGTRRVWVRAPERLSRHANGFAGEAGSENGNGRVPPVAGERGVPTPYWGRDPLSGHPSPPSGTPIILVHGIGSSSRAMTSLVTALGDGHTVLAPDLPGFGMSDPPARPLDVPGLADTLLRWMIDNRIAPAVLLAVDSGCQVAIDLAARRPAMVERLILLGPTEPVRQGPGRVLQRVRRGSLPRPRLSAIQDSLDAGPWRIAATRRHLLADPVEEKLARVDAPTLVICDERGRSVAEGWAERLRAGEPAVLAGVGRPPSRRTAANLVPRIGEFLARPLERQPERPPEEPRRLIVDGMNLIGTRPDGWWRDRPGAWRRLARQLEAHSRRTGEDVRLVLDGRRPAGWREDGLVETAFANGKADAADDAIVARVGADPHPEAIRVATSDRALSERVRELGAEVVSARVLLEELDAAADQGAETHTPEP